MTDTSPEALDALTAKAEGRAGYLVSRGDSVTPTLLDQLVSAVSALRAAPVAMRERAAQNEAYYFRAILRRLREMSEAVGDAMMDGEPVSMLGNEALADEIDWLDCWLDARTRALPLDAPAPVDPVADGAPSDYERKVAQMKEDFPNGI
jgi:hypothetical protein